MTRVPDRFGEIVGFRAWLVGESRVGLRLLSLDKTVWPPGAWLVATCDSGCADVPEATCRCGIYAARTREHLLELGYHEQRTAVVLGEVGLTGKVIPGEQGWRAEKARPLRLWGTYDEWQLVARVGRTYGARVGLIDDLVPPDMRLLPKGAE